MQLLDKWRHPFEMHSIMVKIKREKSQPIHRSSKVQTKIGE